MTKLGHPIFGTTKTEITEVLSILKKTKNLQLTKREIESLYNRKMGTKNHTLHYALKFLRKEGLISRIGSGRAYTPYKFFTKEIV